MKVSHSCIGLFVGLMSIWTTSAYDFTYDAGDIEGSRNSTGITYKLSVSKGNLGTSYDFDTKDGVTSGSPSGIDISVSSGGATGTMEYVNDALPTSNFTISMNGKLIPPSGGSGGPQPTWGASGNAIAPFFITPKNPPVAIGDSPSITFTASENADWSLGSKNNQKTVSVYVEGDPKAPASAIKVQSGKNQTISAFPTGKISPSDSATFTICRTQQYDEKSWSISALNSFTLNDATRGAINNVASKLGVNLTISTINASMKTKRRIVCCDDEDLIKEETKTIKSAGVGFEIKNKIPLPNLSIPNINQAGTVMGVTYDIDIALGVYFVPGDIMFSVEHTNTENICDNTSCDTWGLTGSAAPGIWAGATAIAKTTLLGWSGAGEFEASASATLGISLSGTYSTGDCEEDGAGFHGTIGNVNGVVQVVLDGTNLFTFETELCKGYSW